MESKQPKTTDAPPTKKKPKSFWELLFSVRVAQLGFHSFIALILGGLLAMKFVIPLTVVLILKDSKSIEIISIGSEIVKAAESNELNLAIVAILGSLVGAKLSENAPK